jgi:DNA-binding response OmpR family regulator
MLREGGAIACAGIPVPVSWDTPRPVGEDGPQVLIVERYRDVVELLAYAFRRAGIGFLAVHDAAAALEACAAHRPPVVVVDPFGLDVLQPLRASDDDAAIIVLTAADADELARVAALDVGADEYLTKPFSCTELVACVQTCLLRGRQHPSTHAAATGASGSVGASWPDWIGTSRRFFRSHGGQVWTLDGRLPVELLDTRPWQVPDLLLDAEEYSAEARAYRDAAYQRARWAAWALALNYQPLELARLRALLDRETLIGALAPHRERDPRIQDWIDRLQQQRNGIEDRGARGLDRALSIFG